VGAIMSIMIKLSCHLDDMMPNVMYVLINSVIEMIICTFMWPMPYIYFLLICFDWI
jgi:hypothetical protein